MITTRQINVDLAKEKLKLRGVTTKNIDAGVRVEPPKAKIKPRGVSTTTLSDVADIAEKKRRDDIMVEKKKFDKKDKKKIVQVKKKPEKTDKEFAREVGAKFVSTNIPIEHKAEKKPWNKMNAKERKEYQIEKARKKEEKNEGKDKKD